MFEKVSFGQTDTCLHVKSSKYEGQMFIVHCASFIMYHHVIMNISNYNASNAKIQSKPSLFDKRNIFLIHNFFVQTRNK